MAKGRLILLTVDNAIFHNRIMPKKVKKESLSDLKEEIEEKADDVAVTLEEKAEEAAAEVIEAVDTVKKERRFAKILKMMNRGKFILPALLLLLVIGGGVGVYIYFQNANKNVLGSTEKQKEEVKSIVEKVSRHMQLPGEEPTIATVSDIEKLQSQAFFNSSQNGDKVLIYPSTKKAILYRPSIDRIIDVGIVSLENRSTSTQTTPTPQPKKTGPLKVTIWNGTTANGLTVKGEEALNKVKELDVVERDNASNNDYEGSIVVDLTGVDEGRVKEIAQALQANVADLPDGEKSPDSDILVILGQDFIQREDPSAE